MFTRLQTRGFGITRKGEESANMAGCLADFHGLRLSRVGMSGNSELYALGEHGVTLLRTVQ